MQRIIRQALALVVLCSGTRVVGQAVDHDSVVLGFEKTPQQLTQMLQVNSKEWKFAVTVPKIPVLMIEDPNKVKLYLTYGVDGDPSKCRIQTRSNYAGIIRQVPDDFEKARRLSWKWSVVKHPHNGRIKTRPNDQSIQVYAFYRERKAARVEEWTAINFVWTENTEIFEETLHGHFPWPGSPDAELQVHVIRNGPAPGEFAEDVDLHSYYRKAFRREPPPLRVIIVLGDSSEAVPDVGEMTTIATIRDIRLTK